MAARTGLAKDRLLHDALAGYLGELNATRRTLDSRYDEMKDGQVDPVDGEEAFLRLRERNAARRSNPR